MKLALQIGTLNTELLGLFLCLLAWKSHVQVVQLHLVWKKIQKENQNFIVNHFQKDDLYLGNCNLFGIIFGTQIWFIPNVYDKIRHGAPLVTLQINVSHVKWILSESLTHFFYKYVNERKMFVFSYYTNVSKCQMLEGESIRYCLMGT